MLRKKEAAADAEFVKNLAKRFRLKVTCENADVRGFAGSSKLCVEEAARKLRYDFLVAVARANSASKIALGHNQDDQAETVLMRFLRGSGISGLRGIPPTRELGGCLIIRPLIELRRREIEEFLAKKSISFCTDSSNLKNIYLRNKIRNQLLPSLEKSFNPNIREMLVSFAENVSADFDFLERQGEERFKSVRVHSRNNDIVLSIKKFSLLHKALQKLVARLAIKELKGNVRRIDYRHWKELEELLEERPGGSIVDLPRGVSVVKRGEHLVFYARP
jgi:tRNA(Ile)-lysidine synthase